MKEVLRMKRLALNIKVVAFVILICFVFSACSLFGNNLKKDFGFDKSQFSVVSEKDTHEGSHGDGRYHLVLDCSDNKEKARAIVEGWNTLPMPAELRAVMCLEELDGATYGYISEEERWPEVENGVYKFIDRHDEAKNKSDCSEFLNRYSLNFSVAMYDSDNDILYYFEMDT